MFKIALILKSFRDNPERCEVHGPTAHRIGYSARVAAQCEAPFQSCVRFFCAAEYAHFHESRFVAAMLQAQTENEHRTLPPALELVLYRSRSVLTRLFKIANTGWGHYG